ncbi:MAG TPA: pilus assembly PilX N-terminal domain-containing protein [Conexibacter sp.]|nr:pilus assembly PilX N-terminal domain-containing protein [Conexibacter sp.]
MHLISRIRARLAAQDGFTMIAVLGVLTVGMALTVAAYTAAGGDTHISRNDEDQKRAYAAAEAGVQDYFFHLTQDNAYWSKCTSPTPAHPALNQLGASPLRTRPVPGSNASYAIELIPANGRTACDPNNATGSMIVSGSGPMSGTFSIRSDGFSNGIRRSIVATFRRRSFLDYLYFTDFETSDPAWYVLSSNGKPTRSGVYRSSRFGSGTFTPTTGAPDLLTWAASNCDTYWRNGRGDLAWPAGSDNAWQEQESDGSWDNTSTDDVNCNEIQFVSGDHIDGPLHTNDDILVCGTPTFGTGSTDSIEVSGSGYRQACSGTPNILGTWKPNSPVLTPPPSSTSLKQIADPGYVFRGQTTLVLGTNTISVTNASLRPTTQSVAYPPSGVIYVDTNSTTGCAVQAYQPLAPYNDPAGCADVYVRGTYNTDLTIASAKDIIVNGNVSRSGDRMLGLIADNFVRVYHPTSPNPRNSSDKTDCVNSSSTPTNVSIDAAILALNHSFTVDSYFCGASLGTLTVNGTIAQEFRGPVGTGSGSSISTGYLKDYNYDTRLRLREPPHFLDPVQASWRIQRYAEQVGVR